MNGQFDIGDFSPEKLFIGLSAVLGLLFALIAESQAHPVVHLLHWQIQTTGAVLVVLATHIILFSGSEALATHPWWRFICSGVIGALIFSPLALLSDIHLGRDAIDASFSTAVFDEMLAIVPPITIAWLAINSPWLMGYTLKRKTEPTGHNNQTGSQSTDRYAHPEPDFLPQTELSSARDILYIKSELHYLNLVSDNTKQLILYSLKEAISQLDAAGIDGIHCHRGYWVAIPAIAYAQRSGRQAVLVLSNGEEIPVSRAFVDSCLELFASKK